eukprot:CAMPEP_0180179426 /NCGR_PEP_ID=MMETSP0986-20121125/39008_1 /TAXON_ID=697907 /ORGANISM="non described non described, Strain CCMP2293" /LENGTH=527 /DNA_ID=CAMNT_0022132491 /DNA_START=10 /DNA_END=1590 /DNA_ORIENTATION=+
MANMGGGGFKRDLQGTLLIGNEQGSSLYAAIELDRSGHMTHLEVETYLTNRERYSPAEVAVFLERVDAPNSGQVLRADFIAEVESRGVLEMVDEHTGKAVYHRREHYVEALHFLKARPFHLLYATADGVITLVNTMSNKTIWSIATLQGRDKGVRLTVMMVDEDETAFYVGDTLGEIQVFASASLGADPSRNDASVLSVHSPPSSPGRKKMHRNGTLEEERVDELPTLAAHWQAHEFEVSTLAWVARDDMLVSSGRNSDANVYEICIWSPQGALLGVAGDVEIPWRVMPHESEAFLIKISEAAKTAPPEGHAAAKKQARPVGRFPGRELKSKKVEQKVDRAKTAAQKLATMRDDEVRTRLQRARAFFETYMPSSHELTGKIDAQMEKDWRDQVGDMDMRELQGKSTYRPRRVGKDVEFQGLDRVRSLVEDFAEKLAEGSVVLPLSESVVEEAHAYVRKMCGTILPGSSRYSSANLSRSGKKEGQATPDATPSATPRVQPSPRSVASGSAIGAVDSSGFGELQTPAGT